jgi:hypothetical protein
MSEGGFILGAGVVGWLLLSIILSCWVARALRRPGNDQ